MRFLRRRRPEADPFTATELRRTMSLPGCPICRLVRESEERFLWTLLYELSGDPEAHRRHSSSLGLCGYHAVLLGELVRERHLITPSGVARLYETLVRDVRGILSAGRELPPQRCYLCSYAEETARRYAAALALFLGRSGNRGLYASSEGLCLPHFSLVQQLAAPDIRRFLRADMSSRLGRLEANLRELQRKQRYDVTEPLKPGEAGSWREALWRFGGMGFEGLLTSEP